MQLKKKNFSGKRRDGAVKDQRGVALLASLLLLLLMTGLSVAMVMSVRSDMLINGYYRNFRGSFYAADSGLNIARQTLVAQIQAGEGVFNGSQQPISPSNQLAISGTVASIVNLGPAAASTTEKYSVAYSLDVPICK